METLAHLNHTLYGNEVIKIITSVVMGSILGLEREVRGKAAGFRTLALICFGSTIFTICSYMLGVVDNRDRMAANIITGIGFLGAGVIFKNNNSVSGITTAASIWVAAAVGMLLGIGEFGLAVLALILALFILYILDFIQFWIDDRFQHHDYSIVFKSADKSMLLRHKIKEFKLKANGAKVERQNDEVVLLISISGKETNMIKFNHWLLAQDYVTSFEW